MRQIWKESGKAAFVFLCGLMMCACAGSDRKDTLQSQSAGESSERIWSGTEMSGEGKTDIDCSADESTQADSSETAGSENEGAGSMASGEEKLKEMFEQITYAKGYKGIDDTNPVMTQTYGADPYAMEYDGRLYLYMTGDVYEYDTDGNIKDNGYGKITTIRVISTDDMVNFTDHGAIQVAGKDGAAKWANNSWAPAAAWKEIDGKPQFFLYFADGGGGIGVLQGDSPTGPFRDPLGKGLIRRDMPNCGNVLWLFDPAVLVDDDGKAYIYFGGGVPQDRIADPGTGRVAQLGDDMISIVGEAKAIDVPYLFEDSGIHKANGKYYYTYCTNWQVDEAGTAKYGFHNAEIACLESDSPMGPFTYKETILKNPGTLCGLYGNNHHCVFQFKDHWYITYHSRILEKKMGVEKGYRCTNIDEFEMQADGTIGIIKQSYSGRTQLKYVDPYAVNRFSNMAVAGGIECVPADPDSEKSGCGNMAVGGIETGDYIEVQGVDFKDAGSGTLSIKIRAKNLSGKDAGILIKTDTLFGEALGEVLITPSDGGDYAEYTAKVQDIKGVQKLFFIFGGEGFEVESWQFVLGDDMIAEAIRQEREKMEASGDSASTEELREPTAEISDRIPVKYSTIRYKEGGKIEKISYLTKDYFGDGKEITKEVNVYLPYGYSFERKYNVLYLMHGIGGDENEWGMTGSTSKVKAIMDNLIFNGDIEPFIVVTPNGRSAENHAANGSDYNSFYVFGQELRNDLIPFIEKNYSTYGYGEDDGFGDDLSATRKHRAMAGLSMGGMQTINIGIGECVDLFGYFGAFSAAPTSNTAQKTAEILKDNTYEIYYFYNICGLQDNIAYASASAAAKKLPEVCSQFDPEKNFMWQELKGQHDFDIWYLGFYNFAQLAFKKQ